MVSCCFKSKISIWDLEIKKQCNEFLATDGPVKVFKNEILALTNNSEIVLLNLTNGKIFSKLISNNSRKPVVFEKINDDYVAVAYADFKIRIWNIKQGNLTHTLSNHSNYINVLQFKLTDILISGGKDNYIVVWNITSGKIIYRILLAHSKAVKAFSLIGNDLFASSSDDSTIKFWNLTNGSLLSSYSLSSAITSMKVLANGIFVTGSYDNIIRLWKLNNFTLIKSITGHLQDIYYFSELQDGKLLTASIDNTTRIWNLTSLKWTILTDYKFDSVPFVDVFHLDGKS